MTDHEGKRKIYLARGVQEGLETIDRGEVERNGQLCPGQTESREQDGFSIGQGISHYLFYYIICLL